jgi:hypothetical protein
MRPRNAKQKKQPELKITLSLDGFIRITQKSLSLITLHHLDSGLYVDSKPHYNGLCNIRGYTEWISNSTPTVSLGWDWELIQPSTSIEYKLDNLPFSNLILIDADDKDIERLSCLKLLRNKIHTLAWTPLVHRSITEKYQ